MRSGTNCSLPSPTRNIVRMGEMPVSVYQEKGPGYFLRERIAHVHAHHEVWGEIGAPRSGVVEIVLGVERVVADEAAEDATLNRQTLTDRCEVGNVRGPELPQEFITAKVWSGRRKTKQLRIFSCLSGQLHAPARVFGGFLSQIKRSHVDLRTIDVPRRATTSEDAVLRMVEIQ